MGFRPSGHGRDALGRRVRCRRRRFGVLPAAGARRPSRVPAHRTGPARPGQGVRGGAQGAGHARVARIGRRGGRTLRRDRGLQGRPVRQKRVAHRRHRPVQHTRQVSAHHQILFVTIAKAEKNEKTRRFFLFFTFSRLRV